MDNHPYHIAFAADADFEIPLALALYSLEKHLAEPEKYCIHILHSGLKESRFAPLGLKLCFYAMDDALHHLPTQPRLPTSTYYRFLLPQLLPQHVNRVLYMDCDIMVMQDLSHLWDSEMGDAIIAACPWNIYGKYREEYEPHVLSFPQRLGISDWDSTADQYYYASFLLMDIAAMREQNVTAQLIATAENTPREQLIWLDQDTINLVLRRRIAELPLSCNVIPLFAADMQQESKEAQDAYEHPSIIHFAATKPNILTGAKLPFEEDFFRLWQESPWRRHIPYPLVSLRHYPATLRWIITLPIRLGINCPRFLRLYGTLLNTLRRAK